MSKAILENSKKLLSELSSLSEGELALLVAFHNRKYFVDAAPEISDEAFDKLVEALRIKSPHSPVLFQIGSGPESKPSFGDEVQHLRPMLSLDKCYDDQTFTKWAEKIAGGLVAMPKIDGVASSILYSRQGSLVQAATRGDGRYGENITQNVLRIGVIPQHLNQDQLQQVMGAEEFLEIRGEIYLSLSRFQALYAHEFANPRNLAAGALKNKESDKSASYSLKFIPYDVRGSRAESEEQKFKLLVELGFAKMPLRKVVDIAEARQVLREFNDERLNLDYETDGVVFRANDLKDQNRLGETAHHPRYAIAYKFQTESAQTELVSVEWSLSRTGAITPVAIVKPVFLSGANISRASLHNLGIFLSLGLAEQSLVEMNRRGGVIPHVERVLSTKGQPLQPPSQCPSCHGPVLTDGDFMMCSAKDKCAGVVVSGLIHFCHVLGLEGFGEKLIRRLYEQGFLANFSDIFRLSVADLVTLDRMGDVLANKLIAQIQSKREIDLATFIRALGIDELGTNISELVAANFLSLSRIRSLSLEELMPIHGIGERIALALTQGLKDQADEIDRLLALITVKDYQALQHLGDEANPLFGKSVVFTGKMAHLDRKSAQELVKKLGGSVPGSISAKTDFLVIGDDGSALLGQGTKSTKQKDAEKLINSGSALRIISESDFLSLAEY